jgi:hypothetical protein
MNDEGIFFPVHLKRKRSRAKVDQETLLNLNYLQKHSFKINKLGLQILKKNQDLFLYHYLEMSKIS